MPRSKTAAQWLVSDALWARIQPLVPVHVNTHRFGGGKPRKPDRQCLDAILFVLRTGCPWKALDATGICPGSTAHDRFQEWLRDGLFRRMLEVGLLNSDELKGIDWSWVEPERGRQSVRHRREEHRQGPHRLRQGGRRAQPPREVQAPASPNTKGD